MKVFGGFAGDYEAHRPGYPEELYTHLLRDEPRCVVDLGAGTGRVCRELARRGLRALAVEPDPLMVEAGRVAGAQDPKSCEWHVAAAEESGIESGIADLVVSAQAFHWFDAGAACREAHRLLRPGGRFAVWWNQRLSQGCAWQEAYETLIQRYNPRYQRRYRDHDWGQVIGDTEVFGSVAMRSYSHQVSSNRAAFLGFAGTTSYVRGKLSPEEFQRFLRDLDAILVEHHGDEPFEVPYRTDYFEAQ